MLATEPQRFATKSFAEIAAEPLLPPFARLSVTRRGKVSLSKNLGEFRTMTIAEAVMDFITPKPDDPAESRRLESRREVREHIASIDRDMARHKAAFAKRDAFAQRKKTLDQEHTTATCELLLAERADIEARLNALAGDRAPPDAVAEMRLKESRKQLTLPASGSAIPLPRAT